MSTPMSVKERIAMMKQKEDEMKQQQKTPEAPAIRRTSLTAGKQEGTTPPPPPPPQKNTQQSAPLANKVNVTSPNLEAKVEAMVEVHPVAATPSASHAEAVEPKPMSVAERMAALRAQSATAQSPPPPPPRRTSMPAGQFTMPGADQSTDRTSNQSENAPSVPPSPAAPASVSASSTGTPPPPPPPPGGRRSSLPPSMVTGVDSNSGTASVADRLASLRAGTTPAVSGGAQATPPPPPPPTAGAGSAVPGRRSSMPPSLPTSPAGAVPPPPPPPAAPSLAERMASLRLEGSPVPASASQQPATETAAPPPPPPRPAIPPTPVSPPPAPKPAESSSAQTSSTSTTAEASSPPPRMTIAERMAALKASAAAESSSTPTGTPTGTPGGAPTPASAGGRRVSVGLQGLGAMINLNALSPNAARPPFKRDQPPTPDDGSGGDSTPGSRMSLSRNDDGEIRHLSLSRPSVPSMRRKHATASVRLQANAWANEDILPAGLSVHAPTTRPCSLSSAGDPPSVLSEGADSDGALDASGVGGAGGAVEGGIEGIAEGEEEDELGEDGEEAAV